jgi:hypothetical protein
MTISMMQRPTGVRRAVAAGFALACAGIGMTLLASGSASAADQVQAALNPPPPSSYTCAQIGNGTRCDSDTAEVLDPEPTGIICGTGSDAFEVMDQATRRVKATRWYDANGDLIKRVRANIFSDTSLQNPRSGASVPYLQRDVDTDLFAVPGDLDSATTYSVEHFLAWAPGHGALVVNTGRSVYGPDGSVLSRTGRRDFDAYSNGDLSVMDPLCAALGG